MAQYLPLETIIKKGYLTDVALIDKLLNKTIDLDNPIVKAKITQVGAYQQVYVAPTQQASDNPHTPDLDESKTAAEISAEVETKNDDTVKVDDNNPSNDIRFSMEFDTVEGENSGDGEDQAPNIVEYVWSGTPNAKATTVFKKLGVDPNVTANKTYYKVVDGGKTTITLGTTTISEYNGVLLSMIAPDDAE